MKKSLFIFFTFLFIPLHTWGNTSIEERLNNGAIIKGIEIPGNSGWAYVDVQAVVDVPPDLLWKTLIDIERWPGWLPMNEKAWFVSEKAEEIITGVVAKDRDKVYEIDKMHPSIRSDGPYSGQWHRTAIEEYDLIWPLRDEWVIRRYTFDETKNPYRATWKKLAADDDEDDGSWEVSPWKDKRKSLLKYHYRVKVKKGVPNQIFKTAVSFTVNSMIKSLRREVKRRMRASNFHTLN